MVRLERHRHVPSRRLRRKASGGSMKFLQHEVCAAKPKFAWSEAVHDAAVPAAAAGDWTRDDV